MARRAIVVSYGDEESSFKFTRVDRSKLYGRKERVILDENGERCVPAYLTPDGAALVPPGGTAHLYVDETFDTVERSDLQAVDGSGAPVEVVASTLGVAQALSPVRVEEVLDHVVSSVYELSPETLADALRQALDDGEVFKTVYNYRDGYDPDALFLMKNEEGLFALVAQPSGFAFLSRVPPEDEAAEDGDGEDELDDDLDFSMF